MSADKMLLIVLVVAAVLCIGVYVGQSPERKARKEKCRLAHLFFDRCPQDLIADLERWFRNPDGTLYVPPMKRSEFVLQYGEDPVRAAIEILSTGKTTVAIPDESVDGPKWRDLSVTFENKMLSELSLSEPYGID